MIDGIIIFDLDGTLLRTETVVVPAVREAFARHGLAAPSPEELSAYYGRSAEEYRAWLGGLCTEAQAESVERCAVELELEMLPRLAEPYPGVRDALIELRESVRLMAICSNGPQRYVQTALASLRFERFFDAVRYRVDDDSDKPQMLHDLLAGLDFAPGRPGLVVGDRFDDVEMARANGLAVLGAAYGYGGPGELDGADAVIDDPRRLLPEAMKLLQSPHRGTRQPADGRP